MYLYQTIIIHMSSFLEFLIRVSGYFHVVVTMSVFSKWVGFFYVRALSN